MFLPARRVGLGQWDSLIGVAAGALSKDQGGGGGGGGAAPPPSTTTTTVVSPTTQVQVSPQISPVFQQSSGSGSQSAGTTQRLAPLGFSPTDYLAPGGELPSPDAGPAVPSAYAVRGATAYLPALILGGGAAIAALLFMRRRRSAGG